MGEDLEDKIENSLQSDEFREIEITPKKMLAVLLNEGIEYIGEYIIDQVVNEVYKLRNSNVEAYLVVIFDSTENNTNHVYLINFTEKTIYHTEIPLYYLQN